MPTTLPILIGIFSCVIMILVARQLGPKREMRIYAVGLVVAALIYVGFAIAGDATLSWLVLESGGLVLFTLIALYGLRVSAWALVQGWAAHAVWDVLLHQVMEVGFVPKWYPGFCLGFDLLLAAYIALRLRGRAVGSSVRSSELGS